MTKLCDLLKAIQLSQTHHQPGSGPHNSQASIRTVQSDEFQTLLCLKVWRQNWTLSIIFQVSFQKTYNFCLSLWFVHKSSFVQKYVQREFLVTLSNFQLCSECEEGAAKILEHNTGLFTVSVCVMSNFSKSRVLALQLLTR